MSKQTSQYPLYYRIQVSAGRFTITQYLSTPTRVMAALYTRIMSGTRKKDAPLQKQCIDDTLKFPDVCISIY